MISFKRQYRRSAALLILALVLAIPGMLLASGIDRYRINLEDIEQRRMAISRLEAVAAYEPLIGADRAKSAEVTHAGWFLPNSDSAIAAANLQSKIKELAALCGVDVPQAHDLKPRTDGNITYVGIGLAMSGSAEGIESVLRAIESNMPLLIIEEAQLRAELSGIDPRYEPLTLYLDIKIWAALAAAPEDKSAS